MNCTEERNLTKCQDIYSPTLKKCLTDHMLSEAMETRRWIGRRNGNQVILEKLWQISRELLGSYWKPTGNPRTNHFKCLAFTTLI